MWRSLGLSVAVLCTACSSSYTPQSRGRVSIMMEGGSLVYVRDGKTYPHGFLGGGLEDAVRGNPAAESAADEYTSRLTLGFVGILGGLGCMVGATGFAASKIDEDDDDAAKNALFFALGCSVLTIVATGYLATAEPYRWDAINLFNDAPPPTPMYGPPPARGWAPPRTSLKMRDDLRPPSQ